MKEKILINQNLPSVWVQLKHPTNRNRKSQISACDQLLGESACCYGTDELTWADQVDLFGQGTLIVCRRSHRAILTGRVIANDV